TPRFRIDAPRASARRVLSPEASALITEVLSDDAARREAFGAYNALDLPFPVAVKTGTSKGYRDSWTIGYTRTVTVGVWVGNFDGRPTRRITGARGAGPLFHQVMKLAEEFWARGRSRAGQGARPLHDVPLVRASVCSGESQPRARDQARVGSDGGDCEPGTRSVLEWFTEAQLARADARHLASDGELGGQAAA